MFSPTTNLYNEPCYSEESVGVMIQPAADFSRKQIIYMNAQD